ncbi:MAG: hypothetical protein CFH34_00425 [Alphaproteobacteria bacterium MarineAlpha9_Bin4]|nr:hypothetical protein [Pelagibacterales bacterium]PPR27148.1 MAG: hypothetical protein CFH34_00425 [Alphaproteobacteria bacterium MarineAlpha9_Bin4]|tara:strand:+ start:443 stop:865 length:423 start_codon:yes stop_codon:yes gene_type:complete
MKDKLLYQLRIDLDEHAAKYLISNKALNSCKSLLKVIEKENAKLVCQYEAFKMFVEECQKNNLIHTPLYKWTKDTIENKLKKKKYMKSFTVYVNDEQLYEKNIAERIEKKILSLRCSCILKVNKYNSDPKNNPQPPKKYL